MKNEDPVVAELHRMREKMYEEIEGLPEEEKLAVLKQKAKEAEKALEIHLPHTQKV